MLLKQWSEILRNVTMLDPAGTVLSHRFCCAWHSAGLLLPGPVSEAGSIFLGFFFGMGGSATVAYKFYLSVNKQEKKKHKKNKIYFNRHS